MIRRLITYIRTQIHGRSAHLVVGVIIVGVIMSVAHGAQAETIVEKTVATFVADSLANFFYTLQTIAGWLIYLAGALLNFSINLTMHIKEFVASTEAVYIVWKAIRDISGIFIIGTLLYTAIMMIVGSSKPLGGLIKNIVVAGVLINFSFFLTSVAIDASNIVSLQLYNAIAPQQTIDGSINTPGKMLNDGKSLLKGYINESMADGGLSTIFMQSLGVTRLYNPNGTLSAAGQAVASADGGEAWTASLKITLIGVTSIIIMITAALSFFLASLAFIVRFVILIFLLAFSPIWFASFIVPEIDKYASEWRKYLKNQLIFMPVYLLLMYFALSVLTSSSIFKEGYAMPLSSSGNFLADMMILAVNAVLVIVMLNIPLLGAISMGAKVPGWAGNLTALSIWGRVGNWTKQGGQNVYRDSVSRGASRLAQSQAFQRLAGRSEVAELALKTTRKVAGQYNQKLDQKIKDRESFAQSLNRQGAAAYADRLASSVPAVVGTVRPVMHVVGRADRVGAARILNTRLNEVRTELNRLTGELNQINGAATAAGGLGGLPLYQRQRHDLLTGNDATGVNPGHTNEITDAQNDLNNIQAQVNNFQTTTGASVRDTTRRNY